MLFICLIFLKSSCVAESMPVNIIKGLDTETHFCKVGNSLYITIKKEGLFSNKYWIYYIHSDNVPQLIRSFNGYYSLPIVYNNELLICKWNTNFLTHYISGYTWYSVRSDGTFSLFDSQINKKENENIFYSITRDRMYKIEKTLSGFNTYYWDGNKQNWFDTGIHSKFMPHIFDSLIFADSFSNDNCLVYDPSQGKLLELANCYQKKVRSAVLVDNVLYFADSVSVASYNFANQNHREIFSLSNCCFDTITLMTDEEFIYFIDPLSMKLIQYDIASDLTLVTNATSFSCSDYMILNDSVFSIERENDDILLKISNITDGNTTSYKLLK